MCTIISFSARVCVRGSGVHHREFGTMRYLISATWRSWSALLRRRELPQLARSLHCGSGAHWSVHEAALRFESDACKHVAWLSSAPVASGKTATPPSCVHMDLFARMHSTMARARCVQIIGDCGSSPVQLPEKLFAGFVSGGRTMSGPEEPAPTRAVAVVRTISPRCWASWAL